MFCSYYLQATEPSNNQSNKTCIFGITGMTHNIRSVHYSYPRSCYRSKRYQPGPTVQKRVLIVLNLNRYRRGDELTCIYSSLYNRIYDDLELTSIKTGFIIGRYAIRSFFFFCIKIDFIVFFLKSLYTRLTKMFHNICQTFKHAKRIHKVSSKLILLIFIFFFLLLFQLKCCGMNGPYDWTNITHTDVLPHTCCPNTLNNGSCKISTINKYVDSCLDKLREIIERYGSLIGGVGIGVALVQVRLICFK